MILIIHVEVWQQCKNCITSQSFCVKHDSLSVENNRMEMELPSETSSDESVNTTRCKTYLCTYEGCTASFSKNSRLIYHIRRHTGERPFVCDEPNCGKSYLYSFHLRRHKTTHEKTITERIPCPHEGCYLELTNKYSLRKHIKRKHDPHREYPFTCIECQQGFHRKRQLLQHSYVHTGVLPYMCDVCNLRFLTMSSCNRHKRTHASYSCECGESFERWSKLLAHKKTCESAKSKCNICDKRFKQKTNLKRHLDTHCHMEGYKGYNCGYEDCGRSYLDKKNLIWHINTYHKKILLPKKVCTYENCQKAFVKKVSLKKHIQQCHVDGAVPKQPKPRRPRKDKGVPRTSAAALLVGIDLSKVHKVTPQNQAKSERSGASCDVDLSCTISSANISPVNANDIVEVLG